MLHSPELMAAHVTAIVALVQRNQYAGIDLDYENLHAADRQAFSTFVTRLAHALHAKGKVLSVAVFAKTTNAGTDPRNVAQDYAAIGRAADQVRLMAYDYHWESSAPGPVAPISWVRAVLRYAKTQIPASKIILGVPLYGYDWVGRHGTGDQLARRPCGCPGSTMRPRATTRRVRRPGSATGTRPATSTPCGSRTRRVPGPSSTRPRAPRSAASICGCTDMRTPAPGLR